MLLLEASFSSSVITEASVYSQLMLQVSYLKQTLQASEEDYGLTDTVEHQWLAHLWNHKNMFETG